ncbi:MAG: hypothetical protein JNK46_11545 [Methylobacteriaceae bacterium]|nr:hypothetical protein [Methylobacteriaceae bacterium]
MASYARFSRLGALLALALLAPGGGTVANDGAGVAIGPVGPRVTYSPKAGGGPARPGQRDRSALQNAMEAAPDTAWRPLSTVADSPAPPVAAPSLTPVPPGAPVPLSTPQAPPAKPTPAATAPTPPPFVASPALSAPARPPGELAAAPPAAASAASPPAAAIAADPPPVASPPAPTLARIDADAAPVEAEVAVAPVEAEVALTPPAPARRRVAGFAEVSRQIAPAAPAEPPTAEANAPAERIASLLEPAATTPDSAPQRFRDACRASRGSLVGRGSFGFCVLN